ncbi:MAG: putative metal homeostasis protein [Streptococcaceae bacterium]|nr:putative metal homeostasis protein [Streptococcaceae bacterium]
MKSQDLPTAYRRLKSPSIKIRKAALRVIREAKRNKRRV